DFRVRRGIERRLHVREYGKLGRQPEIGERLGDVGLPRTGANQAGTEAVGLTELEAYVVGGLAQPRRRDLRPPQVADLLILIGQRAPVRGGDPAQGRGETVLFALYELLALSGRSAGIEVQGVVD